MARRGQRSRIAKEHELKIWPEPFGAILVGRKRYEIRSDDRGYAVGDTLVLREWDPTAWCAEQPESNSLGHGRYTGHVIRARVTYLTPGGMWGVPRGLCVMSIEVEEVEEHRG